MKKFETLTAQVAPMDIENVDTDIIIPKQFLKTITREGLGKNAFFDIRYENDGVPKADFVLNKAPYDKAKILLTRQNFGSGSSREHAPWAILDFGIRCLIGEGFADIFYNNCFKNGILPIILPKEQVDTLFDEVDGEYILSVDLKEQTITRPNGETYPFEIDAFRKHCLLNGLDDIGLTLQSIDDIKAYEDEQKKTQPWLWSHAA